MITKSCVSLLQLSRMGFRLCARAPSACSAEVSTSSTRPPHISPLWPVPCGHSYSTQVKVRSYLQYMKHKIKPPPSPPYCHVCQVGDPVLRSQAAAVDSAAITGPEVQKVIDNMVKVMRKVRVRGYERASGRRAAPYPGSGISPEDVGREFPCGEGGPRSFRPAFEDLCQPAAESPGWTDCAFPGGLREHHGILCHSSTLPVCGSVRSEREGRSSHVASQRLASSYPPARDGPPGRGPLYRPHGQQDLHQHQVADLQRIEDRRDGPKAFTFASDT
ncbi:Peptide deformylase, mitochondrial [Collichthys lucidus]|uniref:Peptide deformylase, mitochondrial n=1 Tax=Collichthys lucidus TaxID=240159 RepID=A0A4V6XYK3_COLLU|nr:Peptide deformylase, mitochondrial [Collichthys lucidus]